MDENPFIESSFQMDKPEKRLSSRIAILIIIVVLIILGLFGVSRYLSSQSKKTASIQSPTQAPTEAPTSTTITTPTPTPKSAKVTTTPSPTQAQSSSIDKTTGLDRAKVDISIQNGSGVAGVAAKASSLLKNLGYNVISSGNADNFDYENVTVQVKTATSKYIPLLKKDLSATYTVASATSDLPASSSADVLIIIGK